MYQICLTIDARPWGLVSKMPIKWQFAFVSLHIRGDLFLMSDNSICSMRLATVFATKPEPRSMGSIQMKNTPQYLQHVTLNAATD